MPVLRAQVKRITNDGIYGKASPGTNVSLENLSASPYGPLHQRRVHRAKVGPTGDFFCPVPAGREGDVVRLVVCGDTSRSAAVRQMLKLRGLGPADARRPEVEVQGLRLVRGGDGRVRFHNVRQNQAIGEPGVTLRLINQRSGAFVDLVLDDEGRVPAGTTLVAERGDLFVVAVSDGVHNALLREQWASLCVTDPAQPLDEPSPCLADRGRLAGTSLATASGPLVKDGIDADDPVQGEVGDCWLVATVSAIAHCQPEKIANLCRPLADGRFAVTFKAWDEAAGRYVDHVEIVTPRLQRSRWSGLAYGRSRDGSPPETAELWWPLVEKAYAQWKGSYDAIACGYPYAAFEALLGCEGEHLDFDDLEAGAIFSVLARADAERAPVVLCTRPKEEWPASGGNGLIKDHAYTLLGVREANGERYVRLRNPWGKEGPGCDGNDDGIFELPLESLRTFFCWGSVAR